jgi:hypothetical protein
MQQQIIIETTTYKSTIDTLGHINIISRCPARSILPFFGINRNRLGGACRLAELASDAPLFSAGISPQCVFATETRREWTLFIGVIDGDLGFEGHFAREPEGTPNFGHEEDFGRAFKNVFPGGLFYSDGDGAGGGSEVMQIFVVYRRLIKDIHDDVAVIPSQKKIKIAVGTHRQNIILLCHAAHHHLVAVDTSYI